MLNQSDAQQLVVLLQLAALANSANNEALTELINDEATELWQEKNNSMIVEAKTVKISEAKFE
jgi:hypothetical protein